jgi:hypothetical protein
MLGLHANHDKITFCSGEKISQVESYFICPVHLINIYPSYFLDCKSMTKKDNLHSYNVVLP